MMELISKYNFQISAATVLRIGRLTNSYVVQAGRKVRNDMKICCKGSLYSSIGLTHVIWIGSTIAGRAKIRAGTKDSRDLP